MKHVLLSILLTVLALPALAAPPQLIRSVPANGETNVPLDLQVIRFYFDQNMKMNQWTFWLSNEGSFPPMAGPNDAPWRDPRTCELSIGLLEPNTTYAVQLNSKLRQGFRSAEQDEALPVEVLVFQTGTELSEALEEPTGQENATENAINTESAEQKTPEIVKDPELAALEDIGRKILAAWKEKDVDSIAGYATNTTMRQLFRMKADDESDPMWASMFTGEVWQSVLDWDGSKIKAEKQSDTEARVFFGPKNDSNRRSQLQMVLEDGDWRFQSLVIQEETDTTMNRPADVASAVLKAYKQKDCAAMAEFATAFNTKLLQSIASQGEAHPRYKSVFQGHRMAAVNDWDGRIRDVRLDSESEARVTITDPDSEGRIVQVVLIKEEGLWRFEDLAFDEKVSKASEPVLEIESEDPVQQEAFGWEGDWLYEDPTLKVEVSFLEGKRYTRTTTTESSIEKAQGSYSLSDGILELKEDSGDLVSFPYRIKDEDTFEVQDEGEWVTVRRQSSQP